MESQQTIFLILTGIHNYKRGGHRAPYYLKDVVILDKLLLDQVVKEEKISPEDSELEKVVEKVIKEGKISPSDIEVREKYWLEQHQKIKGEINYLSPRYQAYKAREEKINILTSTGSLILRKGKFAILAYGKAHMKLKKTLGKKQRMSFVEFASVVQDVVDAYKGGK
jgi:polyhydroxyalkanoate synthesis regulator phasin